MIKTSIKSEVSSLSTIKDSIKQHLQPADLSTVTIILHFERSEGYFLMACEPLAICKIALENSFKIPV